MAAAYASQTTTSLPNGSQPQSTVPTPKNVPPGTIAPGTTVEVGKHKVTVERWLSEGGFAHVYVVRMEQSIRLADGSVGDIAVLKRVIAPDKEALAIVRTEVNTMKRLKGHRHVVTYIDSHACALPGGGYEVFLLMEYCSGGGLIDFMNTRLQNRLTESEILKIFNDVAQGVACMHYLQPPLLHRDIKVENVLIASTRLYKLCDFGSAAQIHSPAMTPADGRALEEDIQRHTTLQYRPPEMIDVFRKLPINEKSDIWALGVFLFKLCYYTTPFETVAQQGGDGLGWAILQGKFAFPGYPVYSNKIRELIGWMLREDQNLRPNIFEVVREVSALRGSEVPIRDIYSSNRDGPPVTATTSPPIITYQQQTVPTPTLPNIEPMRRGRPIKPSPSPSPQPSTATPMTLSSSDPFIKLSGSSKNKFQFDSDTSLSTFALDSSASKKFDFDKPDEEDISARFPSIEELSGGMYSSTSVPNSTLSKSQPSHAVANLSSPPIEMKNVEKLADDAFALPVLPYKSPKVEILANREFVQPETSTTELQSKKWNIMEKRPNSGMDNLDDRNFATSQPVERKASPAVQIRQALKECEISSPIVEPDDEERVLKPSEVIARRGVYATHQGPIEKLPVEPIRGSDLRKLGVGTKVDTTNSQLTESQGARIFSSPSIQTTTADREPDARSRALRQKAEESRKIIEESRKALEEQWLDVQKPTPQRTAMVSIGTMTSPAPSPRLRPSSEMRRSKTGTKSPEISPKLRSNLLESATLGPSTDDITYLTLQRSGRNLPYPSPPKTVDFSKGMTILRRNASERLLGSGKPRPRSLHVEDDLDFLRERDLWHVVPDALESVHTGRSTASQPASLPSSDHNHFESLDALDYLRMKDDELDHKRHRIPGLKHERRSTSSGPMGPFQLGGKHHNRQTSLSALSRGLSGKFGEAFRKFEFSGHHSQQHTRRGVSGESGWRDDVPEENKFRKEQERRRDSDEYKVETKEMKIPGRLQQHLDNTRKLSAERDVQHTTVSSQHRAPELDNGLDKFGLNKSKSESHQTVQGNVQGSALKTEAGPSRAAIIQERMNALLKAQNNSPPPLTADGYGPYISNARLLRNRASEEEDSPSEPHLSQVTQPSSPTKPTVSTSATRFSTIPVSSSTRSQPKSTAAAAQVPFPTTTSQNMPNLPYHSGTSSTLPSIPYRTSTPGTEKTNFVSPSSVSSSSEQQVIAALSNYYASHSSPSTSPPKPSPKPKPNTLRKKASGKKPLKGGTLIERLEALERGE